MSRVKHQRSFEVNCSAEELFPLFSAEGEKLWVPGWDYQNVMGSTELHEDYVFLTAGQHKSNDHASERQATAHHHSARRQQERHHPGQHGPANGEPSKMIWLVKRYEPADYFVQFYRVEPDEKVGIVTVRCKPVAQELTEVEVDYEFIGLSEQGNEFIEGYTADVYEAFVANWPRYLAKYLEGKSH